MKPRYIKKKVVLMKSYIITGREGNLKLTEKQCKKIRNRIVIFIKEVNVGFLPNLGSINLIR